LRLIKGTMLQSYRLLLTVNALVLFRVYCWGKI